MSSSIRRRLGTTTFRVAFWYTVLFGVSSLGLFSVSYFYLRSTLGRLTDAELVETGSEFYHLHEESGFDALRAGLQREAKSWGEERAFFVLRSSRGSILVSSDLRSWNSLSAFPEIPVVPPGEQFTLTTFSVPTRIGDVRLLTLPIADDIILQIGQTLQDNERVMREFRNTFLAALTIMLVCGGVVGFFVAKRAMAGVHRVTTIASHVGGDNLSGRVPLGNEGQEISDLAQAFNAMLERVETLVNELREVTDNIAHDLRSPLTRIRGMAEAASTTPQDIDAYRALMGTIVDESDRLVVMINTMLEITETESGVLSMAGQPVDLRTLLRDAKDLFAPLAESNGISLRLSLPPHEVSVLGDQRKLQRVVANLLDNAIKYTLSGGQVMMSLEEERSKVCITIADTGSGIDEAELGHIFERFYRGDKSRSTQGNGLGLSLALAIVRAHHGDMMARSVPGAGSTFSVHLPRSVVCGDPADILTKR